MFLIKICGVTSAEDALLATALGADAVGFVFAPSKRQIAVRAVSEIIRQLPPEIMTVGVFRNETQERVVKTVNEIGLRAAQLHGHETPEMCKWVADRIPVTIKALSAGSKDLERFDKFSADFLLLDSPNPGSGKVFDWALAERVPANLPILLAGGLNSDNVKNAIKRVKPSGVDVSSGVEKSNGKKDPRLLRNFIKAVRDCDTSPIDSRDESAIGDDESMPFDWEVGS